MVAMVQGRWRALVADRRAVDSALVAGCLFLTLLAVKTPWSALPRPVILVAGLAGSLVQLRRRQWPELAAVLGAAGYALSGNPGPWLIGLYSGAAYGPRRRLWLPALAGWAGLVAFLWIEDGPPGPAAVAAAALATALVVIAGVYLTTRRDLLVLLQERAERAEAEQMLRDDRARAAERNRIAREMHDVLAHKVSLIALHAGALELGAGADPGQARQAAALIRVTAREALQELRTVLGILHAEPGTGSGSPLENGEVFADLASLVEASTRAGQRVELADRAGPLPPATARVVYRVVQEGLTNAHRYAPGAPTIVSVEPGPDGTVAVTVHNGPTAGAPIDVPGSGSGLVGLAERIRLVGGSMHSGPFGDDGRAGWQLHAVVPWLDQPAGEQPTVTDPAGPRPAEGAS